MTKDRLIEIVTGRVARNVTFWILFGVLNLITHYIAMGKEDYACFSYYQLLLLFTSRLVFYGPLVYVNNLVLIPQLFEPKKYILYIVAVAGLIGIGLYYIKYLLIWYLTQLPQLGMNVDDESPLAFLLTTVSFVLGFTMAKFAADHFERKHKDEMLQKERFKGELDILKSQINPHFLFNALNTIYGLSIKSSENTSAAIMKLSSVLRYNIYECNTAKVALEKEVFYIENYIEFGKLRNRENCKIEFAYGGDIKENVIAPLLLIPFIENSFKHGLDKSIESPWVKVNVQVNDKILIFTCENSDCCLESSKVRTDKGIGLQNVKRRLELLYKNQYRLNIHDTENTFKVTLKLELV